MSFKILIIDISSGTPVITFVTLTFCPQVVFLEVSKTKSRTGQILLLSGRVTARVSFLQTAERVVGALLLASPSSFQKHRQEFKLFVDEGPHLLHSKRTLIVQVSRLFYWLDFQSQDSFAFNVALSKPICASNKVRSHYLCIDPRECLIEFTDHIIEFAICDFVNLMRWFRQMRIVDQSTEKLKNGYQNGQPWNVPLKNQRRVLTANIMKFHYDFTMVFLW